MNSLKYPTIKNRDLHRVVATAIIHKGGRFLITQRSLAKKAFPGKWTVSGGGLELDDYVNTKPTSHDIWYFALENTLRREVKEEVGLEIGKISYLLDLVLIRPDNVPVLTFSFYAPYKSGKVVINDESIDYAWVTAREAGKYDLIDGILQEIQMVDLILRGKNPNTVKF